MMADGTICISYNALNQPLAFYTPYGPAGQYVYFGFDPLGRCVKRWFAADTALAGVNPATYFYYDGWNMIQEGVNGNAPSRIYVHGARVDEIVASCIWSGNQWAYHHYDARGHCILLTSPDTNASLIEKYGYDAFGLPYATNGSGTPVTVGGRPGSAWGNRFLFTGREWIPILGLYDFRARLYQPELGRFMQPDPKQFDAGDYNLYRYSHNDPVNKTDPFGLEPIEISIRLDQLGIQASDNSLKASSDGYPRSQVIQATNGQLSLQNKINEGVPVKVPGFGSVVPKVMMEEKAEADKGSTLAGIGHAHMDQTGRPAKSESGFSKKDYAAAAGDKKKGLIGVPIYKVNQSDPTRVDRLTPEKTPGDKPTILRVR